MRKRFIYICSPCKGDMERNITKAQGYCREAGRSARRPAQRPAVPRRCAGRLPRRPGRGSRDPSRIYPDPTATTALSNVQRSQRGLQSKRAGEHFENLLATSHGTR